MYCASFRQYAFGQIQKPAGASSGRWALRWWTAFPGRPKRVKHNASLDNLPRDSANDASGFSGPDQLILDETNGQ